MNLTQITQKSQVPSKQNRLGLTKLFNWFRELDKLVLAIYLIFLGIFLGGTVYTLQAAIIRHPTFLMPTFKDPEVEAFAKAYAEFAVRYNTDMKTYTALAASQDSDVMRDAIKKIKNTLDELNVMQVGASSFGSTLEPDEKRKLDKLRARCTLTMAHRSDD